jgi:hypothetical protein
VVKSPKQESWAKEDRGTKFSKAAMARTVTGVGGPLRKKDRMIGATIAPGITMDAWSTLSAVALARARRINPGDHFNQSDNMSAGRHELLRRASMTCCTPPQLQSTEASTPMAFKILAFSSAPEALSSPKNLSTSRKEDVCIIFFSLLRQQKKISIVKHFFANIKVGKK